MTRQTVGETLAARLYAAEAAIDAALFETASFATMLPQARAEAMLSATAGQAVFEGAAASISALTEARARIVDSHNALAVLARKLGLDVLAVGPVDKPEDRPPVTGGVTQAGMLNKTLPSSTVAC